MDTLVSFVIAAVVTLFFVRSYLKKLTLRQAPARPAESACAVPQGLMPCPRCSQQIARQAAFCSHCGAAIAMWSVQQASVAAPVAGEKGKAKPVINASLCVGCGSCIDACPESGALQMVSGKAILVQPELCTGHAKCAEACPTSGITYSYGGVLQTVRVPKIKENFETSVPGLYIAGELGGMGLIKTAINEGKLVMDTIRERLQGGRGEKPEGVPDEQVFDVAIIGAGPAGLSAALSAEQYQLRYLALEQGEIASTIRNYPRHKFLMAEPLSIPLYGNLYVADSTKEALLAVWETIVQNTGVRIQTNERLERVVRNGAGFHVESSRGHYYARHVVLAMGRRGSPRRLGVPGEQMGHVAYRLIEADSYSGKDIVVVGGGDSALEAAIALSKGGRNRLTLVYRGESIQRACERNCALLEKAVQAGFVTVRTSTNVEEIREGAVVVNGGQGRCEVPADFVFILIGGEPPEEFLRKAGVEIVEKSLQAPSFS